MLQLSVCSPPHSLAGRSMSALSRYRLAAGRLVAFDDRGLALRRGSDGELTIEVVDAETHSRSPRGCISRTAAAGRCELRAGGLNQFADHFYIDSSSTLGLRRGPIRVRA